MYPIRVSINTCSTRILYGKYLSNYLWIQDEDIPYCLITALSFVFFGVGSILGGVSDQARDGDEKVILVKLVKCPVSFMSFFYSYIFFCVSVSYWFLGLLSWMMFCLKSTTLLNMELAELTNALDCLSSLFSQVQHS